MAHTPEALVFSRGAHHDAADASASARGGAASKEEAKFERAAASIAPLWAEAARSRTPALRVHGLPLSSARLEPGLPSTPAAWPPLGSSDMGADAWSQDRVSPGQAARSRTRLALWALLGLAIASLTWTWASRATREASAVPRGVVVTGALPSVADGPTRAAPSPAPAASSAGSPAHLPVANGTPSATKPAPAGAALTRRVPAAPEQVATPSAKRPLQGARPARAKLRPRRPAGTRSSRVGAPAAPRLEGAHDSRQFAPVRLDTGPIRANPY